MKLVIDIDEAVYSACNEYKDNTNIGILQRILYTAISNGIPLEDIKEEIEHKKLIVLQVLGGCRYYDGLDNAIKILDKHIKENKQ